ncbi:GNAT family N-acetyltransferase [Pseudomonas sp. UFMG81]|uniref:GNAT family N-acetyltransferase n=1 Tax=Pseudomonas sp. UFMG81 TaxID=2745936 RepID=UPI0018904B17|nr:GNAT family N-acetyltransferase [Pseudomonas sp. UFMG81]
MHAIPGNLDFGALTVRRLHPADQAMICAHREAMFLEAGGDPARLRAMTTHFGPWLQPRLADGRYYGFALLDAGQPIAAIGLMAIDWPPHPAHPEQDQRGYVLNVYVEPSHRRRGLASQLMRLAEAEFGQRGLTFAVLHATDAGRPVYQGLGWMATAEMAKPLER